MREDRRWMNHDLCVFSNGTILAVGREHRCVGEEPSNQTSVVSAIGRVPRLRLTISKTFSLGNWSIFFAFKTGMEIDQKISLDGWRCLPLCN